MTEGKGDGPERKEGRILRLGEGRNSSLCLLTEVKNESRFHLQSVWKVPLCDLCYVRCCGKHSPSNQACSLIAGKQT